MKTAFIISSTELDELIDKSVTKIVDTKLTPQTRTHTEYLTKEQVSKLLHISLVTLTEYTKTGKLKGYRLGKFVRYKRHEIENALKPIAYKIT